MSSHWNDYIENLTTQGLEKVAFVGLDGSDWTHSPGFDITPDEFKQIRDGFSNSSCVSANGIRAGGTKYFYLQSDDGQMQGKKGQCGVTICKTKKCILIATYNESLTPGNARKVLEKMADYLKELDY